MKLNTPIGSNRSYTENFSLGIIYFYNCRLRAKQETYQGETRLRISVVSVSPLEFVKESKLLIDKLNLN
jgi:hypothetical protein